MAHHSSHDELEDGVAGDDVDFIDESDVYAEVPVGDDHPMDDADEEDEEGHEGQDEDIGDIVWEDNSIQQFPNHHASVFAVSTHPTLPIACSGGEDDFGYLWNIETGEQIAKLTGHTDSVTSTAFSFDGDIVSTGGMDGKVRLWKKVGKDSDGKLWTFMTELVGPDEVTWLQWHPKGNVLLAGSNDSTVWLWQLPSGNTMQVFAGHEGPVQCGTFTPDGKRILTADASGTLILWDPRTPTPVSKLTSADARFALGDEGGITSLAVNPSSTLAVVGGHGGGVRVVSFAKEKFTLIGGLEGHKEEDSVEAITFVEFGATAGQGVVVTGGTDGKACVWDLSTMKLRATLEHQDAISSLHTHPAPNAHLITSSSSDKTLRTWDARTGNLIREHKGHQGPVLGAALGVSSKDGTVVVSAGDDGVCLVFPTQ